MITTLEKKELHKELIKMSIHTSLQELFTILPNILNSIMLNIISQTYLSATSLAGQFIMIYTFTSLGLTLAVIMLVNQYYGKNDLLSVKKIMSISILLSFATSIFFFLLSFFFSKQIMSIITNDIELVKYGSEYLKYYSFVFLFNAFPKIYVTMLKAMDKIKVSTIICVISLVVNFILSLVLIYGFLTGVSYGIIGAALASVCATFVELLLFYGHYLLNSPIKCSITELFYIDKFFVKEILKYSIPAVFTKFAWIIADTLITSIIGHMPREVIDSFTIVKMTGNVSNAILTGFSISAGIILGHELGKGNIKKAKEYGDESIKFSIKLGIVIFVITIALNVLYFVIINSYKEITFTFIFIAMVFAYKFFSATLVNYFNNGPFTAGGEVEFLAVVDIVNMWGIIVPIGMIIFYVLHLPIYIVIFFIFSNEITKIFPLYSHYKKYVWARDLTKNEWFLPISGSFVDKYKRNFKLRMNIAITDLFTKRFENTTDFIFSANEENYNVILQDLQKYLENIGVDKMTAYKTALSIEEIYVYSRDKIKEKKSQKYELLCDIGIKLKNDKVRLLYYDNGLNINEIKNDESAINIQFLRAISDKLVYKRVLNLNKIIIRFNRK